MTVNSLFKTDTFGTGIACEQALRGALAAGVGGGGEGKITTMSLEFEYLHQKVNSRCFC